MYAKVKKVRGSASAFAWGELVLTKYSSGCLRHILLASKGVRETIDQKHTIRGAMNEDEFAKGLSLAGVCYDREVNITDRIDGFDDTHFVGRCDFIVPYVQGPVDDGGTKGRSVDLNEKCVEELKSSESYSVYNDVIRKGKYKQENLAQLIAYMIGLRVPHGRLRYTYYKVNKKTQVLEKNAEKVYVVELTADGKIEVDGQLAPVTIGDQLHHRNLAAEVVNTDRIGPRPYKHDDFVDSPCKWCVFKAACDKYDNREFNGVSSFVDEATRCLAAKETK